VLTLLLAPPAGGKILDARELSSAQIARLDRGKTVVLVPGGILEEHGPHLPIFTDGLLNERLARSLAKAITAASDSTVLIFPTIPLGNSGTNDIGHRHDSPGTFTARFETLRAVFMGLADQLGAQGFQDRKGGFMVIPSLTSPPRSE
jgi:creatinine amidohydrolase/Fe(II)-dependent formamide hydrolase-like protein